MAALDTNGKKRKGVPASSPKAKKARNLSDEAGSIKPTKVTSSNKAESMRRQAADVMDVDNAPAPAREPAENTKTKKTKAAKNVGSHTPASENSKSFGIGGAGKSQKHERKAKVIEAESAQATKTSQEKAKKTKDLKSEKQSHDELLKKEKASAHVAVIKSKSKNAKGGAQAETDEPTPDNTTGTDEAEIEDDGEVDDQTAALLAGFGSDDDSDDPSEDLNFEEDVIAPKLTAKQRKAIAKAEQAAKSNEPGVIYVGRIPHGFFEKQMRQYFSQFGTVNRLRLSRNKKTGASKHFAFVEFASTEVADIVARTMDNYLLFGHILKCKLVPTDQVHPDLFKGAGQRFKVDPRNKKAGLAMERGVERAQWEKRVATENNRRKGRNRKLQEEFGYEFAAPALKTTEDIPQLASASGNQIQQELLKEVPAQDTPALEQLASKKERKGAKETVRAAEPLNVTAGTIQEPVVQPVTEKKSKKDKKRKSDVAQEMTTAIEETASKSKKLKKAKLDGVTTGTKVEAVAKSKKTKNGKA